MRKQGRLGKLIKAYADWTRSFGRDQENATAASVVHRDSRPADAETIRRAPEGDRKTTSRAAGAATHLPSFLRRVSGYKPKSNNRAASSSIFSRLVVARKLLVLQDINLPSAKEAPPPTATKGSSRAWGIAFALLALCGIVAAPFLLSLVVFFKSENRTLQQEVARLRENLGRLEQAAQKDAAQKNPEMAAGLASRADQQSGIELSRDEIQFIREYIKPAPRGGSAGPAINTGDIFDGATVPLPAPLTEKMPKLLGARFAIRDGAIVILKRGSDRVNAVLLPN